MIPKTMQAAVVREFGKPLAVEEIPVPEPESGEVLIQLATTGVCHTDLHAAHGDWPVKPTLPFVPGHEGVGYVAAVGAGVRRFREGDLVGLAWLHDACGHCEHCMSGWETLCERQHNTGYNVNGTFAEYAIGHADYVAQLPPSVDLIEVAPILCAGVTTYKGINETEARPGQWLAVSGVGGLGHLAIQYGKAMGLEVLALDVSDDKLALARRVGADITIDARRPDAVAAVLRETGGGAHGVLVTAVSNSAFAQAIQIARRHGTVSLVGLPPGTFPTPIFDVVLKRITVRGSIVGTRQDLAEALEFAVARKVIAQTHVAPLADVNRVFAQLEAGTLEGRMVLGIRGDAMSHARPMLARSGTN
ncbi:MAG TPA: alcohol dehydrogenase AdhP [Steroidobacteraceae bacterium]|nr:alcohol dehydrogenase AdhP [Steroidobacteraceae bacterium]